MVNIKIMCSKCKNQLIVQGRPEEKIIDSIIVKQIFAYNDFSSRYNALKGTALGLVHILPQTAILDLSMKIKRWKTFIILDITIIQELVFQWLLFPHKYRLIL